VRLGSANKPHAKEVHIML